MRWFVNFLIGGIWVAIFNALGWITLSPQPHIVSDPTIGHLLDAAIIAVVICVAGEVASMLYVLFVVATLGLGCLLLPVYWLLVGYFKLWLASVVLSGWFSHTPHLLPVLIMSWILGASRWHAKGEVRGRRHEETPRDPREVQAEWREVEDRRLPP